MTSSATEITYAEFCDKIKQNQVRIINTDGDQVHPIYYSVDVKIDSNVSHLLALSTNIFEFECIPCRIVLWYCSKTNHVLQSYIFCDIITSRLFYKIEVKYPSNCYALPLSAISLLNSGSLCYSITSQFSKKPENDFKISEMKLFFIISKQLDTIIEIKNLVKIVVDYLFCSLIQSEFHQCIIDLHEIHKKTLNFVYNT